jgi:hypothetical protein
MVATEYLYSNIVLDIRFHKGQLARFERCLKLGASRHLRHARTLSLFDSDDLRKSSDFNSDVEDAERQTQPDMSARQSTILHILHMIPDNKLVTFR